MTLAQTQRKPQAKDMLDVAAALTAVQASKGLVDVALPPGAKGPFQEMLGMDGKNLARIGGSIVGPLLATAGIGGVLGRMIDLL
jgi:hypothetical protein